MTSKMIWREVRLAAVLILLCIAAAFGELAVYHHYPNGISTTIGCFWLLLPIFSIVGIMMVIDYIQMKTGIKIL
jgi:hypothetical protein